MGMLTDRFGARAIFPAFDRDTHKAHERHIPAAKCIEIGLRKDDGR
jgi:hypothetical protein